MIVIQKRSGAGGQIRSGDGREGTDDCGKGALVCINESVMDPH